MSNDHARKSGLTPAQQLAEIAEGLHELMRLVDSEIRIELFGLLSGGPKDVGTLTGATSVEMSTVSRGLRGLKDDALVNCRVLRSRREYSLSERVKVVQTEHAIDLSIAAKHGGSLTISLPRKVIDAVHVQCQVVIPEKTQSSPVISKH